MKIVAEEYFTVHGCVGEHLEKRETFINLALSDKDAQGLCDELNNDHGSDSKKFKIVANNYQLKNMV